MAAEWKIRAFNALSIDQLYQILKLRSEVFVVEQNCVYLDIDDKDQKALHLIGIYNGKIVGYARMFGAGDYFETCSIGRVIIAKEFRNRQWGHDLMREAIIGIGRHFNQTLITISAQLYLQNFYEMHGFTAVGQTYLEDDIPHIKMIRD